MFGKPSGIGVASALILAGAVTITASPPAAAQAPSADALFREGTEALKNGDYAIACPKLAKSYGIDPATGTLLALAICYEVQGKVASAWAAFEQVQRESVAANRTDRAQVARDHATALESMLSRLTVQVPADVAQIPGLTVVRDSHVLGRDEWNRPEPVDPGVHTVEAFARGKRRWSVRATIAANADNKAVAVPMLESGADVIAGDSGPTTETRVAGAAPDREKHGAPASSEPAKPILGYGLVAAGAVSLGIGSFFGVRAITLSNDAKAKCPASPCNDSTALGNNGDAKTAAWVADVALGAGTVALLVGGYLVWSGWSSGSRGSSASTSLQVGPTWLGGPGGVVSGEW